MNKVEQRKEKKKQKRKYKSCEFLIKNVVDTD